MIQPQGECSSAWCTNTTPPSPNRTPKIQAPEPGEPIYINCTFYPAPPPASTAAKAGRDYQTCSLSVCGYGRSVIPFLRVVDLRQH